MLVISLVKNFWVILFLIPVCLSAQNLPIDVTSGRIYYAEEVLVKDGPQLDLYNRAKAWFASSGNNKAIQVDDVANGLLIGRNDKMLLVSDGHHNTAYRLWYTIKIEMEDDRYWYSLSDFKIQTDTLSGPDVNKNLQPLETFVISKKAPGHKGNAEPFYKRFADATYNNIQDLIKNIKAHML